MFGGFAASSHDGRFFVVGSDLDLIAGGGAPGDGVYVVDRTLGLVCRVIVGGASAAISSNGRFVATMDADDYEIRVLDMIDGSVSAVSPTPASGGAVNAVSDDGRYVTWRGWGSFDEPRQIDRSTSAETTIPIHGRVFGVSRDGSKVLAIDETHYPYTYPMIWHRDGSPTQGGFADNQTAPRSDPDMDGVYWFSITDSKVKRYDVAAGTTSDIYDPSVSGVGLTLVHGASGGSGGTEFMGRLADLAPGPCGARRAAGGTPGSIVSWTCPALPGPFTSGQALAAVSGDLSAVALYDFATMDLSFAT
jgi:hypothetical protein